MVHHLLTWASARPEVTLARDYGGRLLRYQQLADLYLRRKYLTDEAATADAHLASRRQEQLQLPQPTPF